MKKFYVLLTLLVALFTQSARATQVGYKFPSDGTFSNPTDSWYKTWTSNDGVLKIEGSSEYSFYPIGTSRVCLYEATYTMTVTEGNSIVSYAINNPRGGKSGDTSSEAVFYDANNAATQITTGTWSSFNIEKTINNTTTTFRISATGDDPYMAVYYDYFVTIVDVNNGGGGNSGGTTTATVNFATGGTFSNPTTMPDNSVYYKTWTSTDGNITITGTSGTSFYENTNKWYVLEEGTYTITAAEGNIKSYTIKQPYGYDGEGLITAEDGSTLTVPSGAYASTLTVENINATSTTFTVSGTAGTIWLYDGYMTVTYETESSGGGSGGGDTYVTYTLADGTFSEPYDDSTYAKYLKTWISNDSVVSLTGTSRYNFWFNGGAGTAVAASNAVYFYANNRTFTVNIKDGYSLVYVRLAYPYSHNASATLVADGGISWTWPQEAYPTPEYMDLTTTQFTLQGTTSAQIQFRADYVTFYLKKESTTAIRDFPVKPAVKDNIIYDLQGRRVQTPQKGIYIVNGKKVVFK